MDGHGTRQIVAEEPEQEKLPLFIHLAVFSDVLPQLSFWEEIGKK
jgi:hypothetical protein